MAGPANKPVKRSDLLDRVEAATSGALDRGRAADMLLALVKAGCVVRDLDADTLAVAAETDGGDSA